MNITLADEPEATGTVDAAPLSIGEISVTTHSGTLPVYYVIIGCGTAAVVNHTTLRQTEWGKDRIGTLPVMHIGFKDPWSHYYRHGMGQPPYLLTMPGYHTRPSQVEENTHEKNPGCLSTVFAKCTENEWNLLWDKYHTENKTTSKFEHIEGWVALIQKKDEPLPSTAVTNVLEKLRDNEELDLTETTLKEKLEEEFKTTEADYRLAIIVPESEEEGKLRFVYAKKIDICTGAGRPRTVGAKFTLAKSKPWIPPRLWETLKERKIVAGPEALMIETPWDENDRVYVAGSGGIGLNMVERGEGVGCYGDWAYRSLHDAFNLPRNDPVLLHPTENRPFKAGEANVRQGPFKIPTNYDFVCTSAIEKWRFAKGSDIEILDETGEMILVKIKKSTRGRDFGAPEIRDYWRRTEGVENGAFGRSRKYNELSVKISELDESGGGLYDKICVVQGLVQTEIGEPTSIADGFTFNKLQENGRTVALQSEDKKIRLLGAAAQWHPNNVFKINSPDQVTGEPGEAASMYFFTLPLSAVQPGFIFTGINIALANKYFDEDNPNTNVNTMTVAELAKWIAAKADSKRTAKIARDLALQIIKLRRFSNGYENTAAIKKVLNKEMTRISEEHKKRFSRVLKKLRACKRVAENIETDYPKARILKNPQ